MNYPKMLYKGPTLYTESDAIRDDLQAHRLKTHIVTNENEEAVQRENGFVDLVDLMRKQEPKKETLHMPLKAKLGNA